VDRTQRNPAEGLGKRHQRIHHGLVADFRLAEPGDPGSKGSMY
jgi:hypothetical protein